MSVLSNLLSSGLSLPQAQAVINVDAGTAAAKDLVAAGFSGVEATEILAKEAGTGSDAKLAASGLWAGTQIPAVDAALAVVD